MARVTASKQEKNSSDRPSVTLSYNTNVISPKTMTGVYAFEDGSDKTAYVGINNNTIIIDDVTPGIRKFDIVPFLQVANGSTNILYFGVGSSLTYDRIASYIPPTVQTYTAVDNTTSNFYGIKVDINKDKDEDNGSNIENYQLYYKKKDDTTYEYVQRVYLNGSYNIPVDNTGDYNVKLVTNYNTNLQVVHIKDVTIVERVPTSINLTASTSGYEISWDGSNSMNSLKFSKYEVYVNGVSSKFPYSNNAPITVTIDKSTGTKIVQVNLSYYDPKDLLKKRIISKSYEITTSVTGTPVIKSITSNNGNLIITVTRNNSTLKSLVVLVFINSTPSSQYTKIFNLLNTDDNTALTLNNDDTTITLSGLDGITSGNVVIPTISNTTGDQHQLAGVL